MYYSEFVQHLEEIISEKSIHNKVRKLCETLTQIEPYEIAPVIYLLQGRLAETYIDREHGYGFQRRVADSYRLLQASHIAQSNENIISNLTRKIQQVEISTKKVFVGPDLYSFYTQLHNNVSDLDAWLTFKRQIPSWLIELSDGMNNQEVKLLGYLLRGPLLKDELIIRAIAQLGKGGRGSQQVIMQAYKHCISDLGIIANMVKEKGFGAIVDIKPISGIPLKPQELTRWELPSEAWQTNGPCYVQPKFDGWEIQIHKFGNNVGLFNRHLQLLNPYLPDVVDACFSQISSTSIILDSEMVGFDPKSNRILPWRYTISAPSHKVFVHNIILLDEDDWRSKPYFECRERLQELFGVKNKKVISFVHDEYVTSYDRFIYLFNYWSNNRATEGIVVKRLNGIYRAGKETKDQGKLKKKISLDVVILGYKLSNKGIPSFLVGVWDDDAKKKLIPIGSVEGVICEDWKSLLQICLPLQVSVRPKDVAGGIVAPVWIQPQIVIEVATDGMKIKSDKYKVAGYTFRKKKSVRVRSDLGPEDADKLENFLSFRLPPGEAI